MSKKIPMKCCLARNAWRTYDSRWMRWSLVDLFLWKPDWWEVKMWLTSRNQMSLLLMILSSVLQRQLVRAMGR